MIDYFESDERQTLAGWQTAAVNAGGMMLSYGAGLLAVSAWNRAYLVFLLAVPAALLSFKAVPKEKRAPKQERSRSRSRIPADVWLAALQTALFAVVYFTFSTNVSMLMAEKGFADTSISGTATALFMLGGGAFGLLFKPILKIFKKKTAAFAFAMLAVSDIAIYFSAGLVPLYAAAFLGGGSLSVMFPFFLVTIADKVDPEISVISSSLILSVGPNLGSFVSPVIITNLARIFGRSVAARFLTASVLALLGVIVLLGISLKKASPVPASAGRAKK